MSDPADRALVRELRRHRRDRRLGDIEWFDVASRVYLFALGGTALVIWASDLIDGLFDEVDDAALLARGPAIAGVVAAIAVAVGLRHGAEGGPVSLEPGDARHLLLAPIERRTVLMQPVVQRMRSASFLPALAFAILAQLVGREVIGSRAAWAGAGALFGVAIGATYASTAVIAHAIRAPRRLVGPVGSALVVWQIVTAAATWRAHDDGAGPDGWRELGPFDLIGSVAFWGVRQRSIDVIALVVVVLLGVMAVFLAGRLRLEDLERRGQLVSQLRFAATTQDLRTVVQLRRQLGAEVMRTRSGSARPMRARHSGPGRPARRPRSTAADHTRLGSPAGVVVRRSFVSFSRYPATRVIRLAVVAALAGAAGRATIDWSPVAGVVVVLAVFVASLELLEPLAQEVDHPDRTDGLPTDRGRLYSLLLVGPAVGLLLAAMVGAAVAAVIEPTDAVAAFALAVPVAAGGAIGAVVTTVRDAARPAVVRDTNVFGADRTVESPFSVPEFAGVGNVVTALLPFVLSSVGVVPLVAIDASPGAATVVRAAVGVALCLAVLVWWIRRRDRWAISWREFFEQGRAAAAGS